MIHIGGRMRMLPQDIIKMDADANYTIITEKSGNKVLVATTLKKLEERVYHFKNFLRINRSTIVNLDYAEFKDNSFLVKDSGPISISRRRLKKFTLEKTLEFCQ